MYLFEFIKCSYSIISFANVKLGDAIDEASKKLTPFYDDVEEKFSRIIPTIKGQLKPFDDKYMMDESVVFTGNPITSIEIRAHFHHFPYSTFSSLKGLEYNITDKKYMEVLTKPVWKENGPDAIHQMERRTHMQNILSDYYSFTGVSDIGTSVIGIKIAFPKHNLTEATQESVMGAYTSVNKLLENYERNLELLEKDGKTISFPHRTRK